jgi:hypothetical protein
MVAAEGNAGQTAARVPSITSASKRLGFGKASGSMTLISTLLTSAVKNPRSETALVFAVLTRLHPRESRSDHSPRDLRRFRGVNGSRTGNHEALDNNLSIV